MASGVGLDWSVHPQQIVELSILRGLTTLLLIVGYFAARSDWIEPYIEPFSVFMLLVPSLSISGMVYLTAGGESNYFFGLILLMIFVHLLGFTLKEAAIYCGTTFVAYVLSIYFHPRFRWELLPNIAISFFFLLTSGILSTIICYLNRKNRQTDCLLRESLDEKNQQLLALDSQRMSFLANVSHELRTPLATIVAPLEQLFQTRGVLPESTGQSLALIKRSASRLSNLVNDLLDIVRVDNANLKLSLEEADGLEIVNNCFDEMRSLAEAAKVNLERICTPRAVDLIVDRHRIERVLLNLLTNAIKFSPPDSTILVRMERNDREAIFSVADQGPGVPIEDRERIFERQFQSISTEGLSSGGLGIGLSISKEIMDAHQGKIWMEPRIDSDRECGSIFFFSLPMAKLDRGNDFGSTPSFGLLPSDSQSTYKSPAGSLVAQPSIPKESIAPTNTEPISNSSSSQQIEVLVVDDENDLRAFLVSSIQPKFRVLGARNAEEGLRLARELVPRCILLDYMMPDQDGLQVLQAIRKSTDLVDTKVLMLTAHFDDSVKLRALSLGVDDFLTKPFGIAELTARVTTLVRSSQLQSELREETRALKVATGKQQEAERQLHQSEKMRAVSGLAAGLLHEINNPISYSLMAISALKQQTTEDQQTKAIVDDIEGGMVRISEIISDLRTFAYPHQDEPYQVFTLIQAINKAVKFAHYAKESLPIEISVHCDPGIVVQGSHSQITQVIQNLLSNAIKALSKCANLAHPAIHVDVEVEGDRVRITVRDNGEGIPESNLTKVTEPFFTTSEPNAGLGLGLSICNSIVEKHGGKLQIVSNQAIGTEVSFDLLLSKRETENSDEQQNSYGLQGNTVRR